MAAPRGTRKRIVLTSAPAVKIGDNTYQVGVSIRVMEGGIPLPNEPVQFFIIGESTPRETQETDDAGRATYSYVVSGSMTRIGIEVQTEDGLASALKSDVVLFTLTGARELKEPIFRAEGDNGNYVVGTKLEYTDHTPARNYVIQILITLDGAPGRTVHPLSDENGYLSYNLRFAEDWCSLTIQAGSHTKRIEHLLGPEYNPQMAVPMADFPDPRTRPTTKWGWRRQGWKDAARDLFTRRYPR